MLLVKPLNKNYEIKYENNKKCVNFVIDNFWLWFIIDWFVIYNFNLCSFSPEIRSWIICNNIYILISLNEALYLNTDVQKIKIK